MTEHTLAPAPKLPFARQENAAKTQQKRSKNVIDTDSFRNLSAEVKAQLLKAKGSGYDKKLQQVLADAVIIYDAIAATGINYEFGIYKIIIETSKNPISDSRRDKAIAQLVSEGKFIAAGGNEWKIAAPLQQHVEKGAQS